MPMSELPPREPESVATLWRRFRSIEDQIAEIDHAIGGLDARRETLDAQLGAIKDRATKTEARDGADIAALIDMALESAGGRLDDWPSSLLLPALRRCLPDLPGDMAAGLRLTATGGPRARRAVRRV